MSSPETPQNPDELKIEGTREQVQTVLSPHQKGLYEQGLASNPEELFGRFTRYLVLPRELQKELLWKAAEQNPEACLKSPFTWRREVYAEELFLFAAEKKPLTALEFVSWHDRTGYFKKILEATVRLAFTSNVDQTLRFVDRFISEPYARETILMAAETNPGTVLHYSYRFKNQPYYQDVIRTAVLSVVDFEPIEFFKHIDLYRDQPDYETLLEQAARNAAENAGDELKKYAHFFQGRLWENEVLAPQRVTQ